MGCCCNACRTQHTLISKAWLAREAPWAAGRTTMPKSASREDIDVTGLLAGGSSLAQAKQPAQLVSDWQT